MALFPYIILFIVPLSVDLAMQEMDSCRHLMCCLEYEWARKPEDAPAVWDLNTNGPILSVFLSLTFTIFSAQVAMETRSRSPKG